MTYSFVAYIDESGDEGFKFDRGSTLWFLISAVVVTAGRDRALVELMRTARRKIGKSPDYTLHFRDLRHEQRIAWLHQIAAGRLHTITIACSKRDLSQSTTLRQSPQLYHYLTRFLIERVSWLCRDTYRPNNMPGDGSAKLIFSNRSSLSYNDLRDYLTVLRDRTDVRIHWPAIKAEQLQAFPHALRAGLQVADAVASGYSRIFEEKYGHTDASYARILLPLAYRYWGRLRAYGLKIFPGSVDRQIAGDAEYAWLR